jgi:hypothetical protein
MYSGSVSWSPGAARRRSGGPAAGHGVGRQRLLSRRVGAGHDGRLAHGRVPQQRRLDLPELDPEAADLDLVVDPAQAFQAAVGPPAGQVAGAVEAAAGGLAEGVGQEPLGRQAGAIEVAARHPGAADVQLAGDADGHRAQAGVQHVHLRVGDRPADRHRALAGLDPRGRRPDGRLRRPVQVPQRRALVQEPVRQRARQGLAAAEHRQRRLARPAPFQAAAARWPASPAST